MSYLFTDGRPARPPLGWQVLQTSTVQLRAWAKGPRGNADLFKVPHDMGEPNLTILVTAKEQFPHPEGLDSQPYALVVTFSFDGEEVDLYNLILTVLSYRW